MVAHSFSSLKEYSTCPKRYYHKRIARDVVDVPGEASLHGDRVHKALEVRLGPAREPLPKEMSQYEKLCASIELAAEGCTLEMEKELCVDQRLKPCGWRDTNVYMRSKLDLMGLRGKRGICVDWKTGKRRPDFKQLSISAAQMFIHYPELEVITVAFVWLRENAIDTEVYRRSDLQDMVIDFMRDARRVEGSIETGLWPARPSGLCSFCPAEAICEHAQPRYRGRRR